MSEPVHEIHKYVNEMSEVSAFLSYLPRSATFPSLYTQPYLAWKISHNPFGPSASFLRTRDGRSAAHCSITAKLANTAWLGGARLAELGDTHTHPDFQRQGHFGVLGRHTIDDFGRASAASSLIYGLPNANALPGWLRHCGCEVFEPMHVREMRRPIWRQPFSRSSPGGGAVRLERVTDLVAAGARIDALWPRLADGGWLIKKSSAWWRWRYVTATQSYVTYLIHADGELVGWVVTHRTAAPWPVVGRTAICDIVAITPEIETAALRHLLRRVIGPLDVVTMWTQRGTALDDAATREGFVPVRDVPVIFARNDGWPMLESAGARPRLSLGDTDNI